MSTSKIALAALTGVGAIFAANQLTKPSKTQSIAQGMRGQMDDYNSRVHPEQDRKSVASPSHHQADAESDFVGVIMSIWD